MPNYSNAVIYKIVCKDTNITEIYIGNTTNFNERKSKHKYSCNNKNDKRYNLKVYQYIRANGGWYNFEMVIIENCPCDNKKEVLEKEGYWIKELKANLNSEIPGRTIKEYYLNNKEKRKEYIKNNKEKIKEYQKEYCIINKEKKKEKDKEYYLNNKEIINEKIICECGCEILKRGLKIHQQSAKHINLINK